MEPYKISMNSDRAKPYNRSILTQGASSLFSVDRIEWIFPTTEEFQSSNPFHESNVTN